MANKDTIKVILIDGFMMLSPLLILLYVYFVNGMTEGVFLKAPEWSFVSLFLMIEVMRDSVSRGVNNKFDIEMLHSNVAFVSVFLVLTALILACDFQFSIGKLPLAWEIFKPIKFVWFTFFYCGFYMVG